MSPFDLSRTLPVGGGLLVPCSLPGPPVIKLMKMVTMGLARVGGFSQCASPNITSMADSGGKNQDRGGSSLQGV